MNKKPLLALAVAASLAGSFTPPPFVGDNTYKTPKPPGRTKRKRKQKQSKKSRRRGRKK